MEEKQPLPEKLLTTEREGEKLPGFSPPPTLPKFAWASHWLSLCGSQCATKLANAVPMIESRAGERPEQPGKWSQHLPFYRDSVMMNLKKKATWLWNSLLIWGGKGRPRKKVGSCSKEMFLLIILHGLVELIVNYTVNLKCWLGQALIPIFHMPPPTMANFCMNTYLWIYSGFK